jgi:ferredoxin
MININQADCSGCGLCVETCPRGAIRLVNGNARIDQSRCDDCGACLDVCPNGAIVRHEPAREIVPASPIEIAPVSPALQRPGALAVMGGALAYVGTEILPHVLPLVLDVLEQRAASRAIRAQPSTPSRGRGMRARSQRRGRGSRGIGPGGVCACPTCGYHVRHRAGVPCNTLVCPQCGARLARR